MPWSSTLQRMLPLLAAFLLTFVPDGLRAEEPGCRPEMASLGPPIQRINLARDEVRLTFVGHATFLIETPGGIKAATDYNDYVRPRETPDIATMNKAPMLSLSALATSRARRSLGPPAG